MRGREQIGILPARTKKYVDVKKSTFYYHSFFSLTKRWLKRTSSEPQ